MVRGGRRTEGEGERGEGMEEGGGGTVKEVKGGTHGHPTDDMKRRNPSIHCAVPYPGLGTREHQL